MIQASSELIDVKMKWFDDGTWSMTYREIAKHDPLDELLPDSSYRWRLLRLSDTQKYNYMVYLWIEAWLDANTPPGERRKISNGIDAFIKSDANALNRGVNNETAVRNRHRRGRDVARMLDGTLRPHKRRA